MARNVPVVQCDGRQSCPDGANVSVKDQAFSIFQRLGWGIPFVLY